MKIKPPKEKKQGMGRRKYSGDLVAQDKARSADEAQGTLVTIPPKEPEKLIENKRMKVSYVKPHFDRNKKGNRYVALELSQVVTADHKDYLPDLMTDGWKDLVKKNRKRIDLINVPAQSAKFYMTSDIDEHALEIPAARVTHVSLQVIEEKGTGKANKVVRLSYRLRVPLSRDVAHFSEWNFGDQYFVIVGAAAGDSLLEDEEEEQVAEEA